MPWRIDNIVNKIQNTHHNCDSLYIIIKHETSTYMQIIKIHAKVIFYDMTNESIKLANKSE